MWHGGETRYATYIPPYNDIPIYSVASSTQHLLYVVWLVVKIAGRMINAGSMSRVDDAAPVVLAMRMYAAYISAE